MSYDETSDCSHMNVVSYTFLPSSSSPCKTAYCNLCVTFVGAMSNDFRQIFASDDVIAHKLLI